MSDSELVTVDSGSTETIVTGDSVEPMWVDSSDEPVSTLGNGPTMKHGLSVQGVWILIVLSHSFSSTVMSCSVPCTTNHQMLFKPNCLVFRFIVSFNLLPDGSILDIALEIVAGVHAFRVPHIFRAPLTWTKLRLGLPVPLVFCF